MREPVLDAAALTFVKDDNGIHIGIRQTTADGLGGPPDDEMENASIAKIASFACETFIDSDEPSSLPMRVVMASCISEM